MIMQAKVTTWRAEQNYHRGPKLSLAEVNNQSKDDNLKKCIIHSGSVLQGKAMNFEIYGQVLKGFVDRISRVRTKFYRRVFGSYCMKMPVLFVTELKHSFHAYIFLQTDSPNFILLLPNIRSA
jgi:hypothetical protein